MSLIVTHATAADGSFYSDGAAAWNENHVISGLEWLGAYTFANLPAAASNSGKTATVTDVGRASLWRSNGTRWMPDSGLLTLKHLAAAVTGITNSEQVPLQVQLPAGSWQTGDIVRFHFSLTKSGTTNSGSAHVRIGTNGTTADTQIFNGSGVLGATARVLETFYDVRLVSATSAQKVGSATGTFGAVLTIAETAAVTITSAAANALWVSLGVLSTGATDTVGLTIGRIELLTP